MSKSNGFSLILSGLNAGLTETLARVEVGPDQNEGVTFAHDLDISLERAETVLLGHDSDDNAVSTLAQRYAGPAADEAELDKLFAEMKRQDHAPGDHLIRAGQAADEVFFIESGRAVVRRIQADGQVKRLRTMLPGAIVGDVAYSLGGVRTADVTAETATTTLSISSRQVEKLTKTKPALAFLFNSLVNRALAEKVLTANRMTEHAG